VIEALQQQHFGPEPDGGIADITKQKATGSAFLGRSEAKEGAQCLHRQGHADH